jgi:hypothetical protein
MMGCAGSFPRGNEGKGRRRKNDWLWRWALLIFSLMIFSEGAKKCERIKT